MTVIETKSVKVLAPVNNIGKVLTACQKTFQSSLANKSIPVIESDILEINSISFISVNSEPVSPIVNFSTVFQKNNDIIIVPNRNINWTNNFLVMFFLIILRSFDHWETATHYNKY